MTKSSIQVVDDAILIRIKLCQCCETICGIGPVTQQGFITKKLTAIVNCAITVTVQDQQTIIRSRPAGHFRKSIAVMVKVDARIKPNCFYSITIQVKDQWTLSVLRITEMILKSIN